LFPSTFSSSILSHIDRTRVYRYAIVHFDNLLDISCFSAARGRLQNCPRSHSFETRRAMFPRPSWRLSVCTATIQESVHFEVSFSSFWRPMGTVGISSSFFLLLMFLALDLRTRWISIPIEKQSVCLLHKSLASLFGYCQIETRMGSRGQY
jgi:hypothetical protein